MEQGDTVLPCAAAYGIGTLLIISAGVFTAPASTVKATHILTRPTTASGEKCVGRPLSEGGVFEPQYDIACAAWATVYQAAGGKVSSTNAGGNSQVFGQCVEPNGVTKSTNGTPTGRTVLTR